MEKIDKLSCINLDLIVELCRVLWDGPSDIGGDRISNLHIFFSPIGS